MEFAINATVEQARLSKIRTPWPQQVAEVDDIVAARLAQVVVGLAGAQPTSMRRR